MCAPFQQASQVIYQFIRYTFPQFRRRHVLEIRNDYDNVCKHFDCLYFRHNSLNLPVDFKKSITISHYYIAFAYWKMYRQSYQFRCLLSHHFMFSGWDRFEFAESIDQLSSWFDLFQQYLVTSKNWVYQSCMILSSESCSFWTF